LDSLKYKKKEDISMSKEFIYYRIAEVISVCINFIIRYKRKLSLAECNNQYQMKIMLLQKNMGMPILI
jgi:hypothetical protein